jgi:hypothetical protein
MFTASAFLILLAKVHSTYIVAHAVALPVVAVETSPLQALTHYLARSTLLSIDEALQRQR